MEEIKVGEYVRTNKGIIGKVTDIKGDLIEYADSNRTYIDYESQRFDILKHSSDILELIGVRDFINGLRILDLERKEDRIFACIAKIGPKEYWRTFYKEDIIDIVTKEQYENNCYKVGE